mgnify:CR=1 FL=1
MTFVELQLIELFTSHLDPLDTVNDVHCCMYPRWHKLQSLRQEPVWMPGLNGLSVTTVDLLLTNLALERSRSIDFGCRRPSTTLVLWNTFWRWSDFTVARRSLKTFRVELMFKLLALVETNGITLSDSGFWGAGPWSLALWNALLITSFG